MIKSNKKEVFCMDFDISIEECFKELKPHPKFYECSFDNYFPDVSYPSQTALKDLLKEIANPKEIQTRAWYRIFQNIKPKKIHKNIYIDGTYGIGKTHLLSACFNHFQGSKAFLSFMELTYFMNYAGLEKSINLFKQVELLLIDEFDLDDPATTRMVARFIEAVNDGTTIITTSNRLPKELGGGKFDTERFARELGIISELFDQITVEGKSFRLNMASWQAHFSKNTFTKTYSNYKALRDKLLINQDKLIKILCDNHPFRFFVIPKTFDAVFIEDFQVFTALNDALRFAIFIDHCYYYNTKIFFNCDIKKDLFPKEMKETTFERQFLRCESRMDEIGLFFKNF